MDQRPVAPDTSSMQPNMKGRNTPALTKVRAYPPAANSWLSAAAATAADATCVVRMAATHRYCWSLFKSIGSVSATASGPHYGLNGSVTWNRLLRARPLHCVLTGWELCCWRHSFCSQLWYVETHSTLRCTCTIPCATQQTTQHLLVVTAVWWQPCSPSSPAPALHAWLSLDNQC